MKSLLPMGIAFCTFLGACSQPVIESKLISGVDEETTASSEGVISVSYFLPRQRGRLTVTQSKFDEKALQATLTAAIKAQQAAAKNPKDPLLKEAAALALKIFQNAKVEYDSGKCLQKAKFELLEIEPDPNHHYIAFFKHSIGRDDVIDLKIKDGLLSGAETTLIDRSLDIALQIIKAAVAFQTLDALKEIEKPDCDPIARSQIIDLTATDVEDKLKIMTADTQLRVSVSRPSNKQKTVVKTNGEKYAGLVYRRKLPYVLTICELNDVGECGPDRKDALYKLPDTKSVMTLPVKAGSFVTTKHTLAFENGAPTQVKIEQESEALAVASFPLEVAKAILSVPAEIFQLKINYTNKEKELIDAQKNLIEAQQELLKAKQGSNE